MKKKTLAQTADSISFDEIYHKINKIRIERRVVQTDIHKLEVTMDKLNFSMLRLNDTALVKRKAIIDKE